MSNKKNKKRKGFTLIEILVVIAIIVVLATIVLAFVKEAKARGIDSKAKSGMQALRTTIEGAIVSSSNGGSSGEDYSVIMKSAPITSMVSGIVAQGGYDNGTYQVLSSPTEYAFVFPLKSTSGYWCIDSTGVSKKVDGLIDLTSGGKNCGNIAPTTIIVPVGGNSAVGIVLSGGNPYDVTYSNSCANLSTYTSSYAEPGYVATDAQSHNISGSVSSTGIVIDNNEFALQHIDVAPNGGHITYTVTDPTNNAPYTATRNLNLNRAHASCGNINQPPVISLITYIDNPFCKGWSEPSFTVYDPEDGVISPDKVTWEDATTNGINPGFTRLYKVFDSKGLMGTASRIFDYSSCDNPPPGPGDSKN